ncbi:hypothetical protein EK904_009530 [Melospiza melodia maxima]|nr:hypothetical protein EK904_009530 [Melospiza melodia maxima]
MGVPFSEDFILSPSFQLTEKTFSMLTLTEQSLALFGAAELSADNIKKKEEQHFQTAVGLAKAKIVAVFHRFFLLVSADGLQLVKVGELEPWLVVGSYFLGSLA